jgi:Putative sensor
MNALALRRGPFSLVTSRSLWAGAWYLLGYQVIGWVLFSIALTAALTGALLSVTLIGIPVLVSAAVVLRWCADVERARLRTVLREPCRGRYRQAVRPGLIESVRTRWRDPATWRDVGYVIGLFVPLVALDFVVLVIWLVFLAGITLPAWYWAPWQTIHGVRYHGWQLGYFPNGPHGHPAYGLYIDTLPKALLGAVACLVLFLLFNYVVVATARLHAAAARALLSAPADPLREAKEVLVRPGPLQKFFMQNG